MPATRRSMLRGFWGRSAGWRRWPACGSGRRWPRALRCGFPSVGQDFLSFQWDVLLLGAGLLAVFADDSPIRLWLFRWLLFRLVFFSGAVKLLSGDAAWRNLTALRYHYWTQPLPTPLAWYMHQLPMGFQKA